MHKKNTEVKVMRDYIKLKCSSIHCKSINLITFFCFVSTFMTTVNTTEYDSNNITQLWSPPPNFEYVTPVIQTQILKRKCPKIHHIFPMFSMKNVTLQRTPAFRYINIGHFNAENGPSVPMQSHLSLPLPPLPPPQLEMKGRRGRLCVKCPTEKILFASKYQDGVLIDAPKLHACSGHTLSPTQYNLETLFSTNFRIGLPHGTHSFIGRIRNVKSNEIEKVCSLKYKVIVQKCKKFQSPDKQLKAFCDMGNVWGSKCRFACKNNGKLSHNHPIYCGDDLNWSGEMPTCKYAKPKDLNAKPFNPEQSCELPVPPSGAKFTCKTPTSGEKSNKQDLLVPEGTVCRLKCIDENLNQPKKRIPPYLCWDGKWNTTIDRRLTC